MKQDRRGSQPKTIEAIYRDGVIQPLEPLELPDETRLQITIAVPSGIALPTAMQRGASTAIPLIQNPALILCIIALLIYGATRLVRLPDFPIYFFSDEAMSTVLASDLIRDGFRGASGMLFPPYFKNDMIWSLSTSVYAQVLPVLLLGKSVLIARAVSALFSLLGAAAVALTLKSIFKLRFWWLGILVLAAIPTWFLHSRTAFETVLSASLFALFLLFYLLYRYKSPKFIYPALASGAATFYAYNNAQATMGLMVLLLALFDLPYHWRQLRGAVQQRQWRGIALLIALVVLIALPYIRFRLAVPTALDFHLRILDSYWTQDIPLSEKFSLFIGKYLYGLSPNYWFLPNEHDLIRHRMAGYGHIRLEFLPFFVIGLLLCLWRWRSAAHRTVLLALLVTPFSSAVVDIAVTRALASVIPASILISLGVEWLLARLPERPRVATSLACFALLSLASLWMLRDALVEGPLWYRNYGLGGMQYGATQLFELIPEYLAEDPNTEIKLTPVWANGSTFFPQFFLSPADQQRVQMVNVDAYITEKQPLSNDTLFIMTPEEYEKARISNKFEVGSIEREFSYPDGSPGFYFVHLAYVADVDAIFAAEAADRLQPIEEVIQLRDQPVTVRHLFFEAGQLSDLFDNNTFSLVRMLNANPVFVELTFPEPQMFSGITADFGSMDFRWTISLYPEGSDEPIVYEETYTGLAPDPHVELQFSQTTTQIVRVHIEIEDLLRGEQANIHIRELALQE